MDIDLEKVAKEWSRKRKEEAQRRLGFWGGVTIPVVGGSYGKGQPVAPFQGKQFSKISDLTRNARVGDLLMVSFEDGKAFDFRKAVVSLPTGLPHGYHAAVIAEVSKKKGEVEILDLTIRGYKRKTVSTSSLNNYSLFRINDPNKRKLVVRNMQRLATTQRGLNVALARYGMSQRAINKVNRSMYADALNPVIAMRELFVPYIRDRGVHNANYLKRADREFKFVASNINGIAKDMVEYWKKTGKIDTTHLKPMQRVCTSIAAAVGVPVGRASNPKWSGPNDLLRSGKLKPIGYKVSPKHSKFIGAYNTILKASPMALRVAAGIGLGGLFAGSIAARQVLKKRLKRREAAQEKQKRIKRQIRVKGHMRGKKYVKSHTKVAAPFTRLSIDDLQEGGYERGLTKAAAVLALIKLGKLYKEPSYPPQPSPDPIQAAKEKANKGVPDWKRVMKKPGDPGYTSAADLRLEHLERLKQDKLVLRGSKPSKPKLKTKPKQHTKGHVSIGPVRVISDAKPGAKAGVRGAAKAIAIRALKKKPKRVLGPNASTAEGFKIKMKAGRGYNWLAKEVNRKSTTGGFGALKGTTAKELRKRMGGQMLYKGKSYSFDPLNVAGGGKDAVSGGLSAKQQGRAQKSGAAWRGGGRVKFLAARKAKQDAVKPPSKAQVSTMETKAKRLSGTAKHLRDVRAHASVKHAPGKAPKSLSETRRKAVENVAARKARTPKAGGTLLRGTRADASDFIATQKRFAAGQEELHKGRHSLLRKAHGKPDPSPSARLQASAALRGRKVVRYKMVGGKKVFLKRPARVTASTHWTGDGHSH